MSYLKYLAEKVRKAWKEDKGQFFVPFFLVSVIGGPILMTVAAMLTLSEVTATGTFQWSIWWTIGLIISIPSFVWAFIMVIAYWRMYLYWLLEIVMLPYTIAKWVYEQLQESKNNYRKWKGK